jgi:hypothetical protein
MCYLNKVYNSIKLKISDRPDSVEEGNTQEDTQDTQQEDSQPEASAAEKSPQEISVVNLQRVQHESKGESMYIDSNC